MIITGLVGYPYKASFKDCCSNFLQPMIYSKTLLFYRILILRFPYVENSLHFNFADSPVNFIKQFVSCFFWCLKQMLLSKFIHCYLQYFCILRRLLWCSLFVSQDLTNLSLEYHSHNCHLLDMSAAQNVLAPALLAVLPLYTQQAMSVSANSQTWDSRHAF